MRGVATVLVLLLLAAGCMGDAPEESVELPSDDADPAPPPATQPATPSPVDGIGEVTSRLEPPAAPADPALAPQPDPTPAPAPQPDPTPAPAPQPAPSPSPPAASPTPAPSPAPTPPAKPAWPREGSWVKVVGRASASAPNTYQNTSEWTATWTYTNGDWRGECSGSYHHTWDEGIGSPDESGTFSRELRASDPPHWPLFNTKSPPAVGGEVEVWLMWDCAIGSERMIYSGTGPHAAAGTAHRADDTREAEENYSDLTTYWDTDTGLVLSWSWQRRNSGTSGEVSSDAPIG